MSLSREITEKIRSISERVANLEQTEYTPIGEAALTSAYYRADGSLHTPNALDVAGAFRTSGAVGSPTTGAGVEIQFVSSQGEIFAYDRDAGAYRPLRIRASSINLAQGNVGIDTTSPLDKLHVASGGLVSTLGSPVSLGVPRTTLLTSNNSSPVSSRLIFGTDGTGWQFRIGQNNGGTITDHFTIVTGGNVGIGTTSPDESLHVVGTIKISEDGTNPGLLFAQGGANLFATIQGPVNRDLRFDLDGNNTTDKFHFRNVGSLGALDLLVIQADGNVGIGTASPSRALDVQDNIASYMARFFNDGNNANRGGIAIRCGQDTNPDSFFTAYEDGNGTAVGSVRGDGAGGVNYNQTSDKRKKQDITDLASSLGRILALRPIEYRGKGAPVGRAKVPGFVAQEVAEVMPAAVTYDEEADLYGLAWNKIIPDLVGAIKELEARVASLEA